MCEKPKNYYFEYDSEGNMTKMVEIENTDHGTPNKHLNPHAHDIDLSKPYGNEGRGKPRELTEEEKNQNWTHNN